MSQRLGLIFFLLGVIPSWGVAKEQNAPAAPPTTPPSSRWVVPAHTTIPIALRNTISSRTAYIGQAVYCQTIYPITVGDRIVIPAGTYIKGAVAQVVRPGRVKGTAKIGLRFESITLPSGLTRPLRATLAGYAGEGGEGFSREEGRIEGESSKGEDAAKAVSTGVQGTLIGAIAGRGGKGAGIGAASGGIGGLIWILASRGKELVLRPGTSLELELTAPLSLERDESDLPARYHEGPALPPPSFGPGN
jgi:type IV secretion system protein VirB10